MLSSWLRIELATPNSVPPIDRYNRWRQVVELGDGLPWEVERGSVPSPLVRKDHVTCHVIYLALYSIGDAEALLAQEYSGSEDLARHPSSATGASAAFALDGLGHLMPNSIDVSGSAVLLGAISAGDTNADIATERRHFELTLASWLESASRDAAGAPIPLDSKAIRRVEQRLIEAMKLRSVINDSEPRVLTVSVRPGHESAAFPILNSLYVDDLEAVIQANESQLLGTALTEYLSPTIDTDARIDVYTDEERVLGALAPDQSSLGRWPAPRGVTASTSQQLALNLSRHVAGQAAKSSSGSLFSINGPPGTGKTTLLRDAIAGIFVDRAIALSRLQSPKDAFSGTETILSGKFAHRVPKWAEKLQGFEIVVASSNNGAVQNISLEIPDSETVDFETLGEIHHFPEIATALLNDPDSPSSQRTAWGLIAARLGNQRNRTQFLNAFYFDKQDHPIRKGINSHLKSLSSLPPKPLSSWVQAVSEFTNAHNRVVAALNSRQEVFERCRSLESRRARIMEVAAQLEKTKSERNAARLAVRKSVEDLSILKSDLNAIAKSLASLESSKPPAMARLKRSRNHVRWVRWKNKHASRTDLMQATQDRVSALQAEVFAKTSKRDRLESKVGLFDAELRDLVLVEAKVVDDAKTWGARYPDDEWWDNKLKREQFVPFHDDQLNRARRDLFIAAINLHSKFVEQCADELRKGINGVVALLKSSESPETTRDAARAAWQHLFFFVPVVSTTFASFGRMFRHLECEDLGWLLIDEAGQALPQAAVGALWRSKNVVVLGDPQQLEPVSTVPDRLQRAIVRAAGLQPEWIPSNSSVQTLADRANRWGTSITASSAGDQWIGTPLLTHRRCDNPMFEIANQVAYDGLMVNGVAQRAPIDLPESTWIDVAGPSRGHWIPQQTETADGLVRQLIAAGVSPDQIFIVSPFRAAHGAISAMCETHGVSGGTIHTTQGREANVVVLVLGGNPVVPGAFQWASERPNLLNVAVTRAKRRFYVIGDHSKWSVLPYFEDLARLLPKTSEVIVHASPTRSDVFERRAPWSYEPQPAARPGGRLTSIAVERDSELDGVEVMTIAGASEAIDVFRQQFQSQYSKVTYGSGSRVVTTWEKGVPEDAQRFAVALCTTMVPRLRDAENTDFCIALDWYNVPPTGGASDWTNTETGALVNRMKYSGQSSAMDVLATKIASAIQENPVLASAGTIVTVPGHRADGSSCGERLAAKVSALSGIPHVRTIGQARLQRKSGTGPSLTGSFSIAQPLTGGCIVLDDVVRSGHSINEVARAARAAGAAHVFGVACAKTSSS